MKESTSGFADWALRIRTLFDVVDFFPIDFICKGTDKRFSAWQDDADVTFGIAAPLGGDADDDYLSIDEKGNKFDPWAGRRFQIIGGKAMLPINTGLVITTPLAEEISIEWSGVLELRLKDVSAFHEAWLDRRSDRLRHAFIHVLGSHYLVEEILAREMWPVIRLLAFQQFDSWRLPRPELPWLKPELDSKDGAPSA